MKEVKITGWVAKNTKSHIKDISKKTILFSEKPTPVDCGNYKYWISNGDFIDIQSFPQVTFENSPKKVEITIKVVEE